MGPSHDAVVKPLPTKYAVQNTYMAVCVTRNCRAAVKLCDGTGFEVGHLALTSTLLPCALCVCLCSGSKSQDDAAEDPLTAVKEGLTPNYQLYW